MHDQFKNPGSLLNFYLVHTISYVKSNNKILFTPIKAEELLKNFKILEFCITHRVAIFV